MFTKTHKVLIMLAFFAILGLAMPAQAANWILGISGTTKILRSVDMLDHKFGLAVGIQGTILKTTNGGNSWTAVGGLPVSLDIYDVDVIDQNTAWAVGRENSVGIILKTTDGGNVWNPQTPVGGASALNSVFFFDTSTGFVVGNSGTIWQTTDGGANWTLKNSGTSQNLSSVTGGATTGSVVTRAVWAVGDSGAILRSIQLTPTSEWTSWATQSAPNIKNLKDVSVFASSANHLSLVAVGEIGSILRTTDSGITWTAVSTSGASIYSVQIIGAQGFAVGANNQIIKTTDSGITWANVSSPVSSDFLTGISLKLFGSYLTGIAVTYGGKVVRYEEIPPSQPSSVQKNTPIGDNTPTMQWGTSSDNPGDGFIGTGIVKYEFQLDSWPITNAGLSYTVTFLADNSADGSHTFAVRAVDGAGNTGSLNTLTYTIDTTAPIVNPVLQTTATVGLAQTFSATYSDAVGVTNCWFYVNDSLQGTMSLSNGTASKSHTFSSAGNYSVKVACNDGTYDGWSTSVTVVASAAATDTSAPSGSFTINNGAASTKAVNVALAMTCTDNVGCSQMQISVDGTLDTEPWETYAVSKSAGLPSGDGSKFVRVKFKDIAGNISPQFNVSIILDTTAQDSVINATQKPSSTTAATSATFGFDFSGSSITPVTFECKLDTSVFSSCVSPASYSNLSSGSHTFQVRAIDAAGNVDATPDSYTWTITGNVTGDTTAPSVGSVTPTTAIATYSQSFTVSYSDAIGVTSCNLYVDSTDQGPMTLAGTTSGSASRTYSFSNTVSHTLQARCSDAAGNVGLGALTTVSVSAAPASPADTTAPSTPPGLQKVSNDADATPTFAWNATSDNIGVTSYLIQIDNGSLIDNGGSTSYTIPSNLSNGTHSFKVLAKDAAGNTSPTSSFTFTVNTSSAAVSCPLTMQKAYKSSASKAVHYITTDCTKRPFKNGPSFFTYFDSWSEVITTTQTILNSIANDQLGFTPAGPKYDPKYGALVKIVTDPKVYLLLGTEKYWIISESTFNGLKYDWKWIEDIDPGLLDKYSIGSEITYTDHHPNYTIIKYAGLANTYRLEPDPDDYSKQVKRWIKNEKVFNALKFRWDRIVTVPNNETYKDGKVMDESEVNL